jgi:hypothetical protein
MRYHEVQPMSREDEQAALATGDADRVIDALLSAAYHDPDWRWVQEQCLRFARHRDAAIRRVAVICLGHLARIHRRLDTAAVLPVLDDLAGDPAVAGQVEEALDDIRLFVQQAGKRAPAQFKTGPGGQSRRQYTIATARRRKA